MASGEIALQLTLKALELNRIHLWHYSESEEARIEEANAFNTKQIGDFYQNILSKIKSQD